MSQPSTCTSVASSHRRQGWGSKTLPEQNGFRHLTAAIGSLVESELLSLARCVLRDAAAAQEAAVLDSPSAAYEIVVQALTQRNARTLRELSRFVASLFRTSGESRTTTSAQESSNRAADEIRRLLRARSVLVTDFALREFARAGSSGRGGEGESEELLPEDMETVICGFLGPSGASVEFGKDSELWGELLGRLADRCRGFQGFTRGVVPRSGKLYDAERIREAAAPAVAVIRGLQAARSALLGDAVFLEELLLKRLARNRTAAYLLAEELLAGAARRWLKTGETEQVTRVLSIFPERSLLDTVPSRLRTILLNDETLPFREHEQRLQDMKQKRREEREARRLRYTREAERAVQEGEADSDDSSW